ncbi:hypothetical protein MRX96_016005 [Rhipicephalus microplus]
MFIRTRCSGDNCRYGSTYAHRRSSKVRASRTPKTIRRGKEFHRSQCRAESGELSLVLYTPLGHSTSLRPRNSLQVARAPKDAHLSKTCPCCIREASKNVYGKDEAFGCQSCRLNRFAFAPPARHGLYRDLTSRNAVSLVMCVFREVSSIAEL